MSESYYHHKCGNIHPDGECPKDKRPSMSELVRLEGKYIPIAPQHNYDIKIVTQALRQALRDAERLLADARKWQQRTLNAVSWSPEN